MFIVLPAKSEVVATGTRAKFVACEACEAEYVYAAEREAKGKEPAFTWSAAASARKTAADAERRLDKELAAAVDVVPCPACGHVQDHMVAVARKRKFRWVYPLAGFLSVFAAVAMALLMVLARDLEQPARTVVTVGAALLVPAVWVTLHSLRVLALSVYDPNSEPQHRRQERGRQLARLRADWEATVWADRDREIARLRALPEWGGPATAGR